MTSRRSLLTAAAVSLAAVPLTASPASASARPRLTLPRPTGPHRVGVVAQHLVTPSRELMISVWYPAAPGARQPVAPWMPDGSWRALMEGIGFDRDVADAPLTAGRVGAPALRVRDRLPVVLYSHGNDSCRSETTIVVQELVSHGYVVVTVDHTGDGYVEFPDGRVASPTEDSFTPWDSAHDMLLVLDRLEGVTRRLHLPIDPGRIGMFGWSKGGTSTALMMNADRRIRAGISFDAPMESQPRPAAIDRPFLLMTAENTRDHEPVDEFWELLTGWRRIFHAEGAAHGSYNDQQVLIPQIARLTGMGDEELESWIGTLRPARAAHIQQTVPLAFFDRHLR
jgi:dienelactone hydrolase